MPKNILIVEVNWIGDVLFSTPFIRAIANAYPDAGISCLAHPRCKDILIGNPHVNELILYDEEGSHKSLLGKIRLIAKLRKKKFDTAFILHRSMTKALIPYLAGIRERVGYDTKNRRLLLTRPLKNPCPEPHKVEYFLDIARNYGIDCEDPTYEFFIQEAERLSVKRLLKNNNIRDDDMLFLICPGGNWGPKRWPKRNYAMLLDALISKYHAKAVIAGADKDAALGMSINEEMSNKAVNLCGHTTLKELGALMERAKVVIANDTGPMHMACAVKTNVVALFGPTSSSLTGPKGGTNIKVIQAGTNCEIPCYSKACVENKCMDSIKVDDVLKEIERLIK